MKLSKLYPRHSAIRPSVRKLDKNLFSFQILIKFLILLLGVGGFYLWGLKSPFFKSILNEIENYYYFSIEKVFHMSAGQKVWIFAPALFFDTPRYYLSNFIVFVLSLFKRLFQKQKPHPYAKMENCPLVSLIVPVYNEGKTIEQTLSSILENNYPRFEVIVIDDCSEDGTETVCRRYEKMGRIVYVRKKQREGKPHSLNYGRRFAKGEIIVHVDGDCIFYRDAIFEAVKFFIDPKVGAVAGNLKVMNDRASWMARFQAAEYAMCIGVQRQWLAMTDTLQIASGAFSCFRKKILQNLQGVDSETGEDLDITLKVRKMGYKVAFAPRAICFTEVPETPWLLAKQRILWDRCYIRINLRKHFNIANVKNFRATDLFAVVSDLFFNLFVLLIFPFYLAYIFVYYSQLFVFIAVITYLFYTAFNFIQLAIAVWLSETARRDCVFILYAPLFFLYTLYLRFFRVFAYFLEIFRVDYNKQGYFPQKVWKSMPEHW